MWIVLRWSKASLPTERHPKVLRPVRRVESFRSAPPGSLITLKQANRRVIGPAHPSRALCNRIQHRLNVRRRTSDDAQDLTRGSLLLQRLLEFLEQPHVLDGDNRLVGESF